MNNVQKNYCMVQWNWGGWVVWTFWKKCRRGRYNVIFNKNIRTKLYADGISAEYCDPGKFFIDLQWIKKFLALLALLLHILYIRNINVFSFNWRKEYFFRSLLSRNTTHKHKKFWIKERWNGNCPRRLKSERRLCLWTLPSSAIYRTEFANSFFKSLIVSLITVYWSKSFTNLLFQIKSQSNNFITFKWISNRQIVC